MGYIDAIRENLQISEKKTLKESMYDALRKTIVLGDIAAGERLNELELSTELNISRTPIRYALDKLVEEKLVIRERGVGTRVIGISLKDATELFEIRKALDTIATLKAMTLMTDNDFDNLEQLLQHGTDSDHQDQLKEVLRNYSDFNSFIYKMAQMPRLASIVHDLQTYLNYFRDISVRAPERRSTAIEEHWMIYNGMRHGDPEEVKRLVHEHLDHSFDNIYEEMKRRGIQ
ncbi:GntR family transcriptional regulator [Aerococcaceae bacterium DSM 111020]|nr:GntR family transcriptional regulator [Aerococcaceae bacterium DSM 111020]